jgi:hypothetical protein
MRLPAIALAIAISAPAPAAGPAPPQAVETPFEQAPLTAQKADNCPRTTSHYAGRGSIYQGAPLAPQKLTELPQAVGYMAVYRTLDGCENPLTMVEYRTGRRP